MASQNGHKEVVKLLLEHADVAVNQGTQVRGRRGADGERGMEVGWDTRHAAAEGGSPHSRETGVRATRLYMLAQVCRRCAWRWREGTGLQRGRLWSDRGLEV
jgi:hypothetical protein